VIGTVNIIPTPSKRELDDFTDRVLLNNGFVNANGGQDDQEENNDDQGRDNPNPEPRR
jgi:hypothetical protein